VNFLILHLILLPFLLPPAWEILLLFLLVFYFGRVKLFNALPLPPAHPPQAPVSGAAFCIFGRYEGRKFNLKVVIVNAVVLPVLVVLGDVTENI